VGSLRIGIDLGGTKIEGIALEGSREVARLRVDTPRDDYSATLTAIASLVAHLEHRTGAHGSVGIGIPGAISPATGLVKNANSVWLIGQPLLADLQNRLGREVRIANDANCFAVSEATDGAAAGAAVVFGVIVGTGTGGGIVVHGRVLTGANSLSGEWGHNPLPWPQHLTAWFFFLMWKYGVYLYFFLWSGACRPTRENDVTRRSSARDRSAS
jgi:fructokinase